MDSLFEAGVLSDRVLSSILFMLTIFSVPKAFTGDTGRIQQSAITSWLKLRPECEIILIGDDEGVAEFSSGAGVMHVPTVRRSARGTPRLDSAFAIADEMGKHGYFCFINADIVLLSDFMPAFQFVASSHRSFMITGQRWNMDVREPIDFSRPIWESRLRRGAYRTSVLEETYAMDYFVYPRGLIADYPPLLVGRGLNDHWMVYHALACGAEVVDATPSIFDIHQNHGYAHVGGLSARPSSEEGLWNYELAFSQMQRFHTLLDATAMLAPSGSSHILIRPPRLDQRRPMSLGDRHQMLEQAFQDAPPQYLPIKSRLLAASYWSRAKELRRKRRDPLLTLIFMGRAFRLAPRIFSAKRILTAARNQFSRLARS